MSNEMLTISVITELSLMNDDNAHYVFTCTCISKFKDTLG